MAKWNTAAALHFGQGAQKWNEKKSKAFPLTRARARGACADPMSDIGQQTDPHQPPGPRCG